MHIYCKTPKAIVLVGCESEEGPMRFPTEGGELPGLHIDVDSSQPINEQLIKRVVAYLALPRLSGHVEINQDFSDVLDNQGVPTTLFLATIHARHASGKLEWPTMPTLLRGMPSDRRRLPYLKAWQVLTGALSANTKAIDLEEALKHLKQ
jgi:hypothetical protein